MLDQVLFKTLIFIHIIKKYFIHQIMNDTETKKPIFTVAWGQRIQDLWTIKKWSIFSRNFVEKIFPGSDGSTDRAWTNRIQSSFLNFRRFLMIVKKFGSSREEITSGSLVSRNSLSHNKELIKLVRDSEPMSFWIRVSLLAVSPS